MSIMSAARLRFAPSPTGYLHIGGVRTALFNWLWARKTGGKFILRIEDTDQERSTPESKQVIFDSLRWLGIDWDEGPEVGGAFGPYEQMQRLALYRQWSDKLISEGKAYRCYCTKEELDKARGELKARDPKAQFKYPGTCRDRKDEPGLPSVVRLKTDTSGEVTYDDKVFGIVKTPNKELQDFVLVREGGIPLYNFGCVVDDITMGMTMVARGRDHMINTPPQILLYQAFGAKIPDFAHLPMMLNPSGAKLSKRDGAVGVFEYRDLGFTPMAVLNYLVRFGWSHGDQEVFSKEQLVEAFSWEACGRGDGKFDQKKFGAIQHEHLKSAALVSPAEYTQRVVPFLQARGIAKPDASIIQAALPEIRERALTLVDAADKLDFYLRPEPVMDVKAARKFLVPAQAKPLRDFAAALAEGDWTVAALDERAHMFLATRGLEMKHIAQPARVALTGRTASPGLFEVMAVIGKEKSLARLRSSADFAERNTSA
jgi:glutamyl-tRNA synthetase